MSASVTTVSSSAAPTRERRGGLRKRAWRFTQHVGHLNEGAPLRLPEILPPSVIYLTCQMEICPTTERTHIQGVLYCNTLKSRQQIYRLIPSDIRRCDNLAGAIEYCQKEESRVPDTTFVELGERPAQGKRKDLESFRDDVQSGASKRQLLDTHCTVMARHPRFFDLIKSVSRPARQIPYTSLLVGSTGTGKSTYARTMPGDADYYVVPKTKSGWFDGYDGEDWVIFDDFKGHIMLDKLLEILDPWPVRLEVKGSFVWFTASKLIFTSNFHPHRWYDWADREEQRPAVLRRIHRVLEFTGWDRVTEHDTRWNPDRDTGSIPYLGEFY